MLGKTILTTILIYYYSKLDMRAFIRDALKNEVHAETAIQSEYVKQSQRYHGARSFKFITDYYIER
jgi:hypothetical protein